ncbi:hypothetical protein HYT84_03425 [Candidatus Micrarchaeota archaeon]|nr:hypothetical protein [Candidatus Micrarchaeota archaeon]
MGKNVFYENKFGFIGLFFTFFTLPPWVLGYFGVTYLNDFLILIFLILLPTLSFTSGILSLFTRGNTATLTGAIVVCLGSNAIGLFSNDDELAEKVEKAGTQTHERVWRMPIWKEYAEMIKGDFADIKNIGSESGEAGSITAAMFLKEFVGDTKWVHLDIAGVDNIANSHPYLEKGASGIGLRLVIKTLENLAARK